MTHDPLSLELLLSKIAQGDHDSFEQLYQRTRLHLFGLAVRMLGHGHVADDVLQEAYVSIWKNAGTYRSQINGQTIQAMTWLIAIVRNKALDALRTRTRRKESELAHAPDDDDSANPLNTSAAPSAMQLLERATQALHIDGCMNALDGGYRQSLALAYYQGLSHSEVATQMGAPLGSVKAWIRRGLEKLKNCLGAQGVIA